MNRKISLSLFCAAISVASLASASTANALVLFTSNTASFGPVLTDRVGTPVLSLNKYTPGAFDIITDIVLTISGNVSTTGTVTNTSANPGNITVNVTGDYRFTLPSPLGNVSLLPTNSVIAAQTLLNVPTFTPQLFNSAVNPVVSTTYLLPPQFAAFIGGGTFNLAPFTNVNTSVDGVGGNILSTLTTRVSGSASYVVNGRRNIIPDTDVPFEFSPALGVFALGSLYVGRRFLKTAKA
jgi:hypothetical protein